MSIVHTRELGKLRQIERIVQCRFNKLEIPSGKDVCRKQLYTYMDKLLQADITNEAFETYVPLMEEKFAEMSKEELLRRLTALEFDRVLKYYENAEDLNVRERTREQVRSSDRDGFRREKRDGKEKYSRNGDFTRLFVNLGSKDGFYKASFLQFILDMSGLKKEVLGRIDMKEMNSWIEIDKSAARQMIKSIDGKNFKGRRLRMNEANR